MQAGLLILTALALALQASTHEGIAEAQAESHSAISQELRNAERYRARHELSEAREMQGIWVNEFEGSRFLEDLTEVPEDESDLPRIWLHIDAKTIRPADLQPRFGAAYRVRILARSAPTRQRGGRTGYGHFGAFTGMVVVDEILEWEVVEFER